MAIAKKDRALLVKLFYQNGSNSNAALRKYRQQKGLRRGPMSINGLKKMMKKFEETGELGVAPGRGRRPIPVEVVDEVAVAVADRAAHASTSATSARAVARELSLPWSTVRKVLRCILHWYPYKIQIVHQLKPQDIPQRREFAHRFLARMEVDDMWPGNILWTDEAHFTLVGTVNTQNCRIWGSTRPHVVQEQPLHSVYMTAWCGFTSSFILGPFFFEEMTPRGPVRCTVTSARYRDLLVQHVIPALQERNCEHTTIFMQDGATPHVARHVKDLLRETFTNDRIISRQFPDDWPSRSPDLNPCDFWLWGYLKDRVYQGHVRSLPDLKASIQRHVAQISPDMLRATVDHAVLRMQHVAELGGHIEQFL